MFKKIQTSFFRQKYWSIAVVCLALILLSVSIYGSLISPRVFAAGNSDFTQQINNGTLTTDIRDAVRASVANPSVAFSAITFPFACLTGGSEPTATFGSNTERIYVDNPGAANNGWSLTLAATGGATDVWQNGGATQTYDFNDATAAGCTDGADAGDTVGGQMSVDPSVATINTDCLSCTTTGLTLGSATAYDEGTTDSITLVNAAAGSDDLGRWYLTGIGMSQTIPAEQVPDAYSINLTLTVTAL